MTPDRPATRCCGITPSLLLFVSPSSPRRRATTMVEAVMAMLIVGVTLAAALSAVGASQRGQRMNALHARGTLLAEDLMAEIMQRPFEDPDTPGTLGIEGDEVLGDDRRVLDDIDDYDGWSAEPPTRSDGSSIPLCDGFSHEVTVTYANPSNLSQTSAIPTNVKRIVVTVRHTSSGEVTLIAFRTSAWPQNIESEGVTP